MRKNTVTLLSTYTDDMLVNEQGDTLRVTQGGPAYFINNALLDSGVSVDCITGDQLTAEILLTADGEFGRILETPSPRPLPAVAGDWAIVSTVLDEWDIVRAVAIPKYLCIDLQGYVRDGRKFGNKRAWADAAQALAATYCVKGTKEEVALLPAAVIESQKQKILVVTDGARGLELYYQGTHTHLDGQKIPGLPDTIGAGDTFFGYLVGSMCCGANPVAAAQQATVKTVQFLERKKQLQRV